MEDTVGRDTGEEGKEREKERREKDTTDGRYCR